MRLRPLWLLLPITTACVTPSVASRPERGIDAPNPGDGPAPMVIVDRGERPPPPPTAVQREYVYFGGHPIPDDYGGGWCIEEGAHAHPYLPVAQDQYSYQQGGFVFRSDVEWWDYAYEHPVPVEYGGGWCGLVGVHHHHYRPWLTYWWSPDQRAYVYVSDVRPVSGQKIVRGTRPSERRPPRVITVPATPVPPSGTVARPVPVAPTNGGSVARPVDPVGTGSVARPVPVQPAVPVVRTAPHELPVKPAEVNQPGHLPVADPFPRPGPNDGHTQPARQQPVVIEVPNRPPVVNPSRPPIVTSPPSTMPTNPSRPPMVEPVRPQVVTRPRYEPPTFHEPPPVMNPHYPTATVHNTAPAAVHSAPVAPASTRSVIPMPAAPAATSSKKAPASVVKSQRR